MKAYLIFQISAAVLATSLLITGVAQSFSCDYNLSQPLCPGTIAKCTCATAGNSNQWRFPTLDLCPATSNIINLAQAASCFISSPSSIGTCGPYLSAVNNNPIQANSRCPSSTLTITANPALNGLIIECRDASIGDGTTIGARNITIEVPPASPPNITSLISIYSDQLTATWTSVPTATSYNVSINDSVNTLVPIPSSRPLQYIFTELTSNTIYTISVVAINCAGSSSPATMTGRTGLGLPVPPPLPSKTIPSPSTITSDTCRAVVDTAVGVTVSVTFVVSFSMGALVACVLCYMYVSRRFKNQLSHNRITRSDANSMAVNEVGTTKKIAMEMDTNTAYESHASSTVYDEVGTNKRRKGAAVETNTNTAYGFAS